ncbi:MAG: hypothetical protein J5767_14740 [Paludibacteraceae bacterium]|nr:hypothetical protein [Paludibacteraceae bacterium]
MTIDEYIEFYDSCLRALKMLCSDNQLSDIQLENISKKYWKSIIQEMIDTGAGERTSYGYILKKNAEKMLSSLYYEKKIMDLYLLKNKDKREESMVKSAKESSTSAKWANIWAFISAFAALVSLILFIISR